MATLKGRLVKAAIWLSRYEPAGIHRSMNPAEGLFLYTPAPYWLAFVLLLYRHNLSRLRNPFRDGGGPRSWWLVLSHLGLLSTEQATPMPSGKRRFLPYVVCLTVSMALSLSWTLKVFPATWYYLVVVQGIVGILLTAATIQHLGPPPRRPYVDALRYPRLGSRVRHLPSMPVVKRAKAEPLGQEEKAPRITRAKRCIASALRSAKRRLKK